SVCRLTEGCVHDSGSLWCTGLHCLPFLRQFAKDYELQCRRSDRGSTCKASSPPRGSGCLSRHRLVWKTLSTLSSVFIACATCEELSLLSLASNTQTSWN